MAPSLANQRAEGSGLGTLRSVPVAAKGRSLALILCLALVASAATEIAVPSRARAAAERMLVIWSPHNLPGGVEAAVERIDGVRATTVMQGLDWLTRSVGPDGEVLDDPKDGFAIPIETIVVRPWEFRHYVSPEARPMIEDLAGGGALVSEMERRLRGAGRGMRLRVTGRRERVRGVISNEDAQGYEMIIGTPVPQAWPNAIRFVLVRAPDSVTNRRIKKVAQNAAPDRKIVVRGEFQTPYLRYGDGVRPQGKVKRNFGEFSARRLDGGRLQLNGGWLNRNIRHWSVPILGSVTCHRKLFPILRGALREVKRKGLGYLIRPGEYAGCFFARFIATIPGTRLSRHSWATALDINSSSNCFGCSPNMDARVVHIFRRWGFTWGGTWPIPDGMHFEWYRWPN